MFLTCASVDYVAGAAVPDVLLDDLVRMTAVMLKLQSLQGEDEREKLGNCPSTGANNAGGKAGGRGQ